MDKMKVRNVLIAVFDKSSVDDLVENLKNQKSEIWATQGTADYIKIKFSSVHPIVSSFDFNGRLKTLSRELFARILADRGQESHMRELKKMGIEPIDLVIVDLYAPDKNNFPESMDVGGQALIRAAIKNYKNVALAFDKESIRELVDHLKTNQGSTLLSFRKAQAKKAAKFIAKRTKLEAELLNSLF